jgi:hypothetical protein
VPVIVIWSPGLPLVDETPVITGGLVTVNAGPVAAIPLTVTTTLPVTAPAGTTAVILVSLQYGTATAFTPPNDTILVPCAAPKLDPEIVTPAPTTPDGGQILLMVGGTVTVNGNPLAPTPPTVMTTLPVVAPAGTATVMLVSDQLDAAPAAIPLKVTVLDPWLGPKLAPVIVTDVPTGPDTGHIMLTLGGALTRNVTGPVVPPGAVTVTLASPGAAPALTAKVAVIWFWLSTFTLLTAIPGLLTFMVEPGKNLPPVSVTPMVAPCEAAAGAMDDRLGGCG